MSFSEIQNLNSDHISPGRKRLLSKKNVSEEIWDFNQDHNEKDINSIKGARVFHQKFGYGYVVNFDGDKVEVNFDKSSQKKIFVKYLQFIS